MNLTCFYLINFTGICKAVDMCLMKINIFEFRLFEATSHNLIQLARFSRSITFMRHISTRLPASLYIFHISLFHPVHFLVQYYTFSKVSLLGNKNDIQIFLTFLVLIQFY